MQTGRAALQQLLRGFIYDDFVFRDGGDRIATSKNQSIGSLSLHGDCHNEF
jgi:hypothetical protein